MKIEELKTDREKLLTLRNRNDVLMRKIDSERGKSRQSGELYHFKYGGKITHEGKEFDVNWATSYGTKEQREMIQEKKNEIYSRICVEERKEYDINYKEITNIYEKYKPLTKDIWCSEAPCYDGEANIADLLLVAVRALESVNNDT